MSLAAGTRLAHYEILEAIGKGVQGEVYRAKDSKLGRDVAIKVLPDEFAENEERLARFKREAKVLASLNHPNIASIYGLEQSDNTHYLVLELVPGETLAERIARGPISLEEALDIATKMAEALEEAHEEGIVHRDLKPANVKQTEDGKIKVLDFGLAKVFQEETPDADSSMSPTLTRDGTRVGVILGTAAYMSPEQAKGKRVDKRTDVFAFGAVLYEMLTGKKAFPGEDVSDVLASVIKLEPDWSALPAKTPPGIRTLVKRCLRKDPARRLHAVADARIEIEELDASPQEDVANVPRRNGGFLFAAGFVVAALGAGGLYWMSADVEPRPEPKRVSIQIPATHRVVFDIAAPVISPDGRHVAYIAEQDSAPPQLFLRSLDRFEATAVQDTEGIIFSPFFSPDGQWLGYSIDDELRKVSVTGGIPVTLARIPGTPAGSWGSGGAIWVSEGRQVMRVPENGGDPVVLLSGAEDEPRIYWPRVLPGSKAALYSSVSAGNVSAAAVRFDTAERRVLVEDGKNPHYLETGHLVFARGDRLFAAPFDPEALELLGLPTPVVEGVLPPDAYRGQFSLSRSGTLLYVPDNPSLGRIVWVDRKGNVEPVSELRRNFIPHARLSPDGRRLAVSVTTPGSATGADIWILEIGRDVLSRLTRSDGRFLVRPFWLPDGQSILYSGGANIVSQSADGSGEATMLAARRPSQSLSSVSSDGKFVLFREDDAEGSHNIGRIVLDGTVSFR